MNKRELNELVAKIQEGDEYSFSLLYNETYKGVFSFIYSIILNYEDSEDLMQETFIKIRQNIQSYKLGTNVSSWMLQIAKNLTIDFLRKEKKKNTTTLECIENVIPAKESNIEQKIYLHDKLNEYLPEIERQIVILHIINGYKNREIAKLLKIPLGTVLWKYNRAMKILKEKLEEEKDEK